MSLEVIYCMVLGLLGAITHAIMWAKKPSDIATWENTQGMVLGVIAGYLYALLHGQSDIIPFVAGYAGKDFIEGIIERFKPFKTEREEQ